MSSNDSYLKELPIPLNKEQRKAIQAELRRQRLILRLKQDAMKYIDRLYEARITNVS